MDNLVRLLIHLVTLTVAVLVAVLFVLLGGL